MADDNKDGALAVLAAPGLATAAGISGVFDATREFITDQLKPEIIPVADPESGAQVLALVSAGAVTPLPDTFFDSNRDAPRYRRGTAAMTSLASFIDHINRFGDDDSAVFADDNRTAPKLTAVIDYHRADIDDGVHGDYRHGKHRTTFAFPLSDEWKAWLAFDGKTMPMAEFALFLEDRIGDIAIAGDSHPAHVERFVEQNGGEERIASYAALIELSRGLKVFESAKVEEAVNLSSGEGQISFSVEHDTRNQTGGKVKVPTMFFISIPVFRKGVFYRIAARLRYRKAADGVKFWFNLWRPDLSFDDAFAEAVAKVDEETPASVFFGAPEA